MGFRIRFAVLESRFPVRQGSHRLHTRVFPEVLAGKHHPPRNRRQGKITSTLYCTYNNLALLLTQQCFIPVTSEFFDSPKPITDYRFYINHSSLRISYLGHPKNISYWKRRYMCLNLFQTKRGWFSAKILRQLLAKTCLPISLKLSTHIPTTIFYPTWYISFEEKLFGDLMLKFPRMVEKLSIFEKRDFRNS